MKTHVTILMDDLDWLLRCAKSCLNSTDESIAQRIKDGEEVSASKTMAFRRARRRFRRALRAYETAKLNDLVDNNT